MALIAALVSAYAVSNARFALGKIPIACCKNSTPSMRGIRWSARSKATLSLRIFNCFKRSSAPSGESLPITRYSAPYCERRSRSIARRTSESSSTLSNMGLAMLGLGFGQRHDYRFLLCVHDLIRYRNLNLVAQIPVTGNVNRLSEPLIQKGCFSVVSRAGRTESRVVRAILQQIRNRRRRKGRAEMK